MQAENARFQVVDPWWGFSFYTRGPSTGVFAIPHSVSGVGDCWCGLLLIFLGVASAMRCGACKRISVNYRLEIRKSPSGAAIETPTITTHHALYATPNNTTTRTPNHRPAPPHHHTTTPPPHHPTTGTPPWCGTLAHQDTFGTLRRKCMLHGGKHPDTLTPPDPDRPKIADFPEMDASFNVNRVRNRPQSWWPLGKLLCTNLRASEQLQHNTAHAKRNSESDGAASRTQGIHSCRRCTRHVFQILSCLSTHPMLLG